MLHSRIKRVEHLLRSEIANILLFEVQDPRLKFVTVTSVKMSKDLQRAIVFVTVLADSKEKRDDAFQGLESAKGFIKKQLASRVVLKFMPELTFKYDKSLDHAEKIDAVLKELRDESHESPNADKSPDDR
jgi:ribosome-binding factor A